MPGVNLYARALSLPLWSDSGMELPDGVELRKAGDLAALHLIGTTKVLGFVPSRFDKANLPALLERLEAQS